MLQRTGTSYMAETAENQGNILVNPELYAKRLQEIEGDQEVDFHKRLEDHLAHRIRLGGAITYVDDTGRHVIEDRDGVRPFPPGSKFPSPAPCAELEIRELAFRHGIHGTRTGFDDWAEAITAIAGDEIRSDEVELMLIGLGRLDVVDGVELTKLHARYLQEIMNP